MMRVNRQRLRIAGQCVLHTAQGSKAVARVAEHVCIERLQDTGALEVG